MRCNRRFRDVLTLSACLSDRGMYGTCTEGLLIWIAGEV